MKRLVFIIMTVLLLALTADNNASAAIAVDRNSDSNCNLCSGLTYTVRATAGGLNRLLVVGVIVTNDYGAGIPKIAGISVVSVTYNGQNLSRIGTYINQDLVQNTLFANEAREEQWYLVAPPTGAHNLVITLSAETGNLLSGAISLTGVSQTTPIRAFAAADSYGTAGAVTVSSQTGDLVLDTVCSGSGVDSSNQTQQYILNIDGSVACNNIGGSTAPGGASVNMSWTLESDTWIDFASSIEPVFATDASIGQGARLKSVKINY